MGGAGGCRRVVAQLIDASQPFRLGMARVIATTQPGEARFFTHVAEPVTEVGPAESRSSSGF